MDVTHPDFVAASDEIAGSYLFCGGAIQTPDMATLSQSEQFAAGDVTVGILSSVRGTAPVTVRAGGRAPTARGS